MLLAANFPDGSGYVLAAYLVFFALLLIYLGVTAYRLLGLEKRLSRLTEQLDRVERQAQEPEATEEPTDAAERPRDGVA